MATGAANGVYGLLTWIAGGAVAVGAAVGALYYTGMIAPSVSVAPDEPVTSAPDDGQPRSQPDIASTSKPTPNIDDDVQPTATAEATPSTADDAAQDDAVVAQPESTQPKPALSAPGFDVVRVDPDGNAVIAGTGPAGARVTIFLDGQEQVSTTVDRSGAFVSLLSIAPSQTARILSMTAELDGQTRASDDQIILAPTPVIDPEPVEDVQVAGVEPDPATTNAQPVKIAEVEPDQPVATEKTTETTPVSPAEDVQTTAAEPEPVESDPAQIELAQSEPAVLTGSSQDGAVQVAQAAPAQDQPASEPAATVATPKTLVAQSEPSDSATTPTKTDPLKTIETGLSEPQIADSDVVAQPVATNKMAEADATTSDVATLDSPSQSAVTQVVEAVVAIQSPPQDAQTEQSEQTAPADSSRTPEAVPDDKTPAVPPVTAKPAPSDNANSVVTSVTTPTAVAPTEDPDTTSGTPTEVAAQTDPVVAPDTNAVQATETPTETPVTTRQPSEPPAPAPQEEVNTAVPDLAPAPVQPLAPSQPSLQSQPQSPALITILRAGPDGVEVLQSGTSRPQTPDKIALDLISYSEAGEIQLSGRAQVQSVVRVYLDNQPVGDLVTDDTGRWSGEIKGITPGIYTLRLDELGQAGVVLSRIETPFKRETPEVLRPPQDPNLVATDDTADGGPVPQIRAVTVQQGDTLWAISRARYGDGVLYVRVFEANRGDIRDPDLIYPGQVFALPE